MRWLIVVVVALVPACAGNVMLMKWKPDAAEAVIGVGLSTIATKPNDMQIHQADVIAKDKCGGDYKIVEEGIHVDQGVAVGIYGGGTYDKNTYYWVVRCVAELPKS